MGVAVADGLTGLAAMASVALATEPDRRLSVLAGMAGAAFLDLDKPSSVFFGFSPFPAAAWTPSTGASSASRRAGCRRSCWSASPARCSWPR